MKSHNLGITAKGSVACLLKARACDYRKERNLYMTPFIVTLMKRDSKLSQNSGEQWA